jgi:YbgC/YbaW family acyl-CoA thioester hydrolase
MPDDRGETQDEARPSIGTDAHDDGSQTPTSRSARRFRVREFVRWSDVDKAGIIHWGAYVRFFEIIETEMFRAVGLPYSQIFDRLDFWLPRVRQHFEFRAPAFLDDLLEVEAWIGRIGRSSLQINFEVRRAEGDQALTADGHVVMVAIDRVHLRPIPLPESLVRALEPYTAPQP